MYLLISLKRIDLIILVTQNTAFQRQWKVLLKERNSPVKIQGLEKA